MTFDGSFNYANSTAGIGGIMRDRTGTLVMAYANRLAVHQPLAAEMQAFLQGLKLLPTLSPLPPPGIIFKDDAFNIINRLSAQNIMPWKLMSMWKQILLNISRISVGRGPAFTLFSSAYYFH